MVIWVTEFKSVINFSFVWCCDVMTSYHDVTKPDLPISACRCASKLILFLFSWFLGHRVQKCYWFFTCVMLWRHDVISWRHVMMSLNLIHLSSSACRCTRKLICFCFHKFFKSLSSKMLMIFNCFNVLASWRHVMTSQKLFHLSQVMDLLERWSCSWFHGFPGCLFWKC